MTSTRDFLQKLRLGSLLASQQCKLGSGPLAHLLGIHALCLKKEAKHSITQYFNMLVSKETYLVVLLEEAIQSLKLASPALA